MHSPVCRFNNGSKPLLFSMLSECATRNAAVELNCDSTRLSVIDKSGILYFYDLQKQPQKYEEVLFKPLLTIYFEYPDEKVEDHVHPYSCVLWTNCLLGLIDDPGSLTIAETSRWQQHKLLHKGSKLWAERCMEYEVGRWQSQSSCCHGERSNVHFAGHWTWGACCLHCLSVQLSWSAGFTTTSTSLSRCPFYIYILKSSAWWFMRTSMIYLSQLLTSP